MRVQCTVNTEQCITIIPCTTYVRIKNCQRGKSLQICNLRVPYLVLEIFALDSFHTKLKGGIGLYI